MKRYSKLLEDAMAQKRKGDIKAYSDLTAQSEEIMKQIERLEKSWLPVLA